jgi:hypothetical protein
MKKTILVGLITLLLPSVVFAQDVSVEEILGTENEEISQNIEQQEEERTKEIENELNISIPEYSDNPSHIITFVDPSKENDGVELDIDENGYKEINSPYSLPSLSIGEHHLKFRFVDSLGATKVLEYDMVIIPRPPIVKAPQFSEKNLLISGTGLANSEVVLTVSIGANNYTQIANIDGKGSWNTSITLENIYDGIYTIFGYTRKDGYASNPSEPAVMEYGNTGLVTVDNDNPSKIAFDFNNLQLNNIPGIIANNPDLLIILISFLLLGALVTSIIFILTRKVNRKEEEEQISQKINGKQPKAEKTLRELLETDNSKVKEKKPKDVKKKEKKSKKDKKKEEKSQKERKEKVFTRQDFLKDFVKFDPDKDSGKENKEPSKKEKKDVIVTLTSKREEE